MHIWVSFANLRNSKINWKICLWGIFQMIHLFKIRSFHSSHLCLPLSIPPRGGNWKHYVILCLCTSRAVETVYLLVYSVYLWNYNFFRVRYGYSKSVTGKFLKDTAIFVKQLLLKVWHNGKVYHSLKCCFSSAFRLLFKGKSNNGKRIFWNRTYSSLLSCLTCFYLLKELDF